MRTKPPSILLGFAASALLIVATSAQDADVVRTDHYVTAKSAAPSMAGQETRLYVREVRLADTSQPPKGIVLFVHGAGTPAEVAFDVPYQDFSWMAYLARGGFDVFAMDLTGYGRSTRPAAMRDPCNLQSADQTQFIPSQIAATCPPSLKGPMTTIASDWDDIGAVVDALLAERHEGKVALIGWSQGGPRTFGYALAHPDKVSRIVALAPAYNRAMPSTEPPPDNNGYMSAQSDVAFKAGWDRQVGCRNQYAPETGAAIWTQMLASDPFGASWTPHVRLAPRVPMWGFNGETAARMTTPYLMVTGEYDKQVLPEHVRALYADLGSADKVFVDLACSSHNAMWEKNHLLLFKASLDWLATGKVEGISRGEVRLGY